ncbi:MAG: hypothetical protein KAT29_11050, partial [Anaerolineales bacterium]|nr:hypothetical protein [Anaerolineales bacterium]
MAAQHRGKIMARTVLEIVLSLKGDKARRELAKVDKSFSKVDKSAKRSEGALKKFDAKMALVAGGAGLAAAGVVKLGEAIWNMGKRGAAVEQTGESFDFLLDKLKVTPSLLADMRREFRGTVDDMTIMSSIMTLTAGTGDDLGKMLMDAAPQLAEVAKAANKLNPTLGDTAFMFSSIATGVKRAQPLILDNLGLTIKVGAANEAMAKQLGKSVEALTAEEKAMAILNATLKAGDQLIAQVGGSVDAYGDDIARAEVQIKNLKDEWAVLISGPVADTASALTDAINKINELRDAVRTLDGAYFDGIITLEEWNDIRVKQQRGEVDAEWVTRRLEQATRNWRAEMGLLDFQLVEMVGHERAYVETLTNVESASDDAGRATEEYAKRLDGLNQASADAIETLRGLLDLKIKDFFDVDMGIGDVAARMFDITQFKEFGGEALEIMVKEVQAGLVQGKITPEQSREFFKNIAVEAEAIKIKMGEIDAEQAAESISTDFNIPIKESRELIDSVLEGIDLVNSADISAITEEFDALQERKEKLLEAGELDIEADPHDKAQIELERLQEQVDILTAEPWLIEFQIVTTGEIPTVTSGTVTDTEVPDYQHGGDFIAPPGYTNDGYPIQVHSGEHVTVTPAGQ